MYSVFVYFLQKALVLFEAKEPGGQWERLTAPSCEMEWKMGGGGFWNEASCPRRPGAMTADDVGM